MSERDHDLGLYYNYFWAKACHCLHGYAVCVEGNQLHVVWEFEVEDGKEAHHHIEDKEEDCSEENQSCFWFVLFH